MAISLIYSGNSKTIVRIAMSWHTQHTNTRTRKQGRYILGMAAITYVPKRQIQDIVTAVNETDCHLHPQICRSISLARRDATAGYDKSVLAT